MSPIDKDGLDMFSEMLSRNAEQQEQLGNLGNEIHRERILDRNGLRHIDIAYDVSRLIVDEYGIPTIIRERIGKQLDCRHIAVSIDQVGAICAFGHVLCRECLLFTCDICGDKCCELDTTFLRDGRFVCAMHGQTLGWNNFKRIMRKIFLFD